MRDDGIDPVLQAAATAFGFVYVHPFEDGNGRLHRCLIHHVLAERKFTPPGIVFPVSSVMLDRIDDYRTTLQAHSGPRRPFTEWRPTSGRNVEVLNDTADLYRYVDGTDAAEFLYACVRRTVEDDLPREIDYLRRHDEAIHRLMEAVEMPDALPKTSSCSFDRTTARCPGTAAKANSSSSAMTKCVSSSALSATPSTVSVTRPVSWRRYPATNE
jgi:Fic/DOC family